MPAAIQHATYCHATVPTPERPDGGCVCDAKTRYAVAFPRLRLRLRLEPAAWCPRCGGPVDEIYIVEASASCPSCGQDFEGR